jgi:hypothetical protein
MWKQERHTGDSGARDLTFSIIQAIFIAAGIALNNAVQRTLLLIWESDESSVSAWVNFGIVFVLASVAGKLYQCTERKNKAGEHADTNPKPLVPTGFCRIQQYHYHTNL